MIKIKRNFLTKSLLFFLLLFLFSPNKSSRAQEFPFTGSPFDYELSFRSFHVLDSYEDGFLVKINRNILAMAKDFDDFRILYNFEETINSSHVLPNGNILIATCNDYWSEKAGSLFLSKDKGKSFKKVLDYQSGSSFHWNFSSDNDGYVFVSEYGIKKSDNARRIYRSKDFGESFQLVYQPEREEGYHNHIIHIDKLDKNTIYQVVGDDNKRLLISKDRGDSWETIYWGDYHPISLIDLGEKIIFGLDDQPFSGLILFDKASYEVSPLLEFDSNLKGPVYSMVEDDDGTIYLSTLSYADIQSWDGGILYSKDQGKSWNTFFTIKKGKQEYGAGSNKLILTENFLLGDVYANYKESDTWMNFRGSFKIPKI